MSPRDLYGKLNDVPFKPFRIRLTNNTTLDVTNPGVVVVGRTSAVLPIRTSKDDFGYTLVDQWRTVALSHMAEFVDPDPPKEPLKRRKGKS